MHLVGDKFVKHGEANCFACDVGVDVFGNAGLRSCKMLVAVRAVSTLASTRSLRKSVGLGRCSFSQAASTRNSAAFDERNTVPALEFRPSQMPQSRTSGAAKCRQQGSSFFFALHQERTLATAEASKALLPFGAGCTAIFAAVCARGLKRTAKDLHRDRDAEKQLQHRFQPRIQPSS